MAIWQFHFSVIPKELVLKKYSCIPEKVEEETIEDARSWNGYSINELSVREISNALKPTKSWIDDIKQFGASDETCIELLYNNSDISEISVRLDLRNLTLEVMKEVLDFIRKNKAIILTNEGCTSEPIVDDVIRLIKKSNAYSFVNNPTEYLSSIAEQSREENS
jgi:hypothetical protein